MNNTSADVYSPRSNWALDDTSVPPRRFEVSPQVSAGPNERVDGDDDQNPIIQEYLAMVRAQRARWRAGTSSVVAGGTQLRPGTDDDIQLQNAGDGDFTPLEFYSKHWPKCVPGTDFDQATLESLNSDPPPKLFALPNSANWDENGRDSSERMLNANEIFIGEVQAVFFVTFMVKEDSFVELIYNRILQPLRHKVAKDERFLKKSSYLRLFAEMHEDMAGII